MRTSIEPSSGEPVRWSAVASWKQFTWLFMFCAIAGLRAGLLFTIGDVGWIVWAIGSMLLFLCIAVLRTWAQYVITSSRVIVRNAYTGAEIQVVRVDDITDVSIDQGPVARMCDIGTVVLRTDKEEQTLVLRGVSSPETVKTRLDALRP